MSKLPPPSDTPRVFLNVGTLSGLDVLTIGTVAPGATVQLKDESIGVVISVKRGWLSLRPRSAQIKLQDGTITKASRRDIAEVLREAPLPDRAAPIWAARAGRTNAYYNSGHDR